MKEWYTIKVNKKRETTSTRGLWDPNEYLFKRNDIYFKELSINIYNEIDKRIQQDDQTRKHQEEIHRYKKEISDKETIIIKT